MAPKRVVVQSSSRRQQQQESFLSAAYKELTSSENATIVRSVLVFGVCSFLSIDIIYFFLFERTTNVPTMLQAAVAFLHSSLSEFLLPP